MISIAFLYIKPLVKEGLLRGAMVKKERKEFAPQHVNSFNLICVHNLYTGFDCKAYTV